MQLIAIVIVLAAALAYHLMFLVRPRRPYAYTQDQE